jgi:hypothetical protein
MVSFTGIAEGALAVQDFMLDRPSALPSVARAQIRQLIGQTRSPVDAVCRTAEIIYANRDAVDDEVRELGAALATLAEAGGFQGMDLDNRGGRIAAVLRGGEVAELPEPKPEYLPAPIAE